MNLPINLPRKAARLFPHYDLAEIERPENRDFLIARLLEEGDRSDLHWLVETVGEAELRRVLEAKGGRNLSRRSRSFFELVLGSESGNDLAAESVPEVWTQ